jgi:hypothetical protein
MLCTNSPVTWILLYGSDEYEVSQVSRRDGTLMVHMVSLTTPKRFRFGSRDTSMTVGSLLKEVVKTGQGQGRPVHLLRRSQGSRGVTETCVL